MFANKQDLPGALSAEEIAEATATLACHSPCVRTTGRSTLRKHRIGVVIRSVVRACSFSSLRRSQIDTRASSGALRVRLGRLGLLAGERQCVEQCEDG